MNVLEFKFKGDDRKVSWEDERFNVHTVNKESEILPDEMKEAMAMLREMIARHLGLPKERIVPVGVVRTSTEDDVEAFTLVGELTSPTNSNVVMAKKLETTPSWFFPASEVDGVYYDEFGVVIEEKRLHLPENHLKKLTQKEEEFLNKTLEMAGVFATSEGKPVQPSLFDDVQDEDVDVEEVEE